MDIKIVSPIFGFEEIKEAELERVDDYFYTLKAAEVSFTLLNPKRVREYQIKIAPSYEKLLDIDDEDEIEFFVIMILQNPIENSFVNFAAPLVLNKTKAKLVQIALDESSYPQYLLSEPISNYL